MKKHNDIKIFGLILLLVMMCCACSGENTDAKHSDNSSDEKEGIVASESTEEVVEEDVASENTEEVAEEEDPVEYDGDMSYSASFLGNWYGEFSYYVDAVEEHEVYVYVTVHHDDTFTLRWVEPADPEDQTETFEYRLVRSKEEVVESFRDIYYDEGNDQLIVNLDGEMVTLSRMYQ